MNPCIRSLWLCWSREASQQWLCGFKSCEIFLVEFIIFHLTSRWICSRAWLITIFMERKPPEKSQKIYGGMAVFPSLSVWDIYLSISLTKLNLCGRLFVSVIMSTVLTISRQSQQMATNRCQRTRELCILLKNYLTSRRGPRSWMHASTTICVEDTMDGCIDISNERLHCKKALRICDRLLFSFLQS